MSLVIKAIEGQAGKVHVICDEETGEMIANHISSDIHHAMDEVSTITVTLHIDGDKLKIES